MIILRTRKDLVEAMGSTHPAAACRERLYCPVHNPKISAASESWPAIWRAGRGIIEVVCIHGVGHPEPSQQEYLGEAGMVHGCDGCCFGLYD